MIDPNVKAPPTQPSTTTTPQESREAAVRKAEQDEAARRSDLAKSDGPRVPVIKK